ncbi:CRTAC1 family protein [Pseudenhygromyxa sp. WMMC2535]|uniref:CRTAC1 family protein n=1 Tax=Pseudenhygromyxa sp. WMMC2535 TaxID=2712867 RepID=UPI0020D056A3|nr:CRTAC1 family protein [Pseudenhygromyxa sp. WMMC2535]
MRLDGLNFLFTAFVGVSLLACPSDPGADSGTGEGGETSESGELGQDESGESGESGETGEPMACEPTTPEVPTTGFFTDISDASGIRVDNYYEDPPEGTSINDHSRLAFVDIDGDGWDDLVAHSLYPNAQNGVPFEHLVFRNLGDGSGSFEDFSDASGLREVQAGFFAFADVDNDGDQDAFAGLDLNDYDSYTSSIWLNDGAGHFSELPGAGVEDAPALAANAVFADFNGDGIVDLFVGMGGTSAALGDRLYAGLGDGTFDDVSAALQNNPSRPSNGSVVCDFDDDGDLDIFVSTYSVSTAGGHNQLFVNQGGGLFDDLAEAHSFAYQITGNYWLSSTGYGQDAETDPPNGLYRGSNGFGIDCGDVDNDGDFDVLLSTISHPVNSDYNRKWSDPSQLLANEGADAGYTFVNQWQARGLPFNEGDVDAALVDFDNDGRLDISLSRERKYEGSYDDPEQKSWFGLMRQLDTGAFESLGVDSGINDPEETLLRMKGAQNHAWSDIDHDGDLDLLVGGRDQGGGRPNFLFRNEIGHANRWLAVRVEGDGDAVDRDGLGTRVTVRSGNERRVDEKKSSRGMYNSEDTRVLHFGLGDMPCDELELVVRWTDGSEVVFDRQDFGENMYVRVSYPDVLEIE